MLVHASGVHATIAGVLLGFAVPVLRGDGHREPDARQGWPSTSSIASGRSPPASRCRCSRSSPPGVTIGGWSGFTSALSDPVTLGVVIGLMAGKPVGIFGTTYLLTRFTRAELDAGLTWVDVFGLSLLAGIGFTVSLLIGELAFGASGTADDHVKVGVLTGSVLAAVLATVVLHPRNRAYQRLLAAEALDVNRDGIPDVFEGER